MITDEVYVEIELLRKHGFSLRNLRIRLIYEYMTEPEKFAEDLSLAKEYSLMLLKTFNCLRQDAIARLGHKTESLPEALALPRPG